MVVATPETVHSYEYGGFFIHLVEKVAGVAEFTPIFTNISEYPNNLDSWPEVEMVAGDLTVGKEREEAMDFSLPFMNSGLVILLKKPQPVSNWMSFLKPFSSTTWLLLLASYSVVALLMFLTSRLEEPAPSLAACLWLPLASLLGNSTDYLPRTMEPGSQPRTLLQAPGTSVLKELFFFLFSLQNCEFFQGIYNKISSNSDVF